MKPKGKHLTRRLSFLLLFLSVAGCVLVQGGPGQVADDGWTPTLAAREFSPGSGPVVLVDAAHGNFHTLDGRFAAFGNLLQLDGYQVRSAASAVSDELLHSADIFVISNAVYGGDDAAWKLPTPSAFTQGEIATIAEWVRAGGSLLLIADHMPFPGATAELADAFGIVFLNGFAVRSHDAGGTLSFTRSSGLLADHVITRGRSAAERVESIRAFTGQAFRFVGPVQPLMIMPDDWRVLLPAEAWQHSAETPSVSSRGLIQGGVLRFGAGRVAVFGEAAMFTAQTVVRNGVVHRAGMNNPEASGNAQFVVNVMHWLSGLLDD